MPPTTLRPERNSFWRGGGNRISGEPTSCPTIVQTAAARCRPSAVRFAPNRQLPRTFLARAASASYTHDVGIPHRSARRQPVINKTNGVIVLVVMVSVSLALADHAHGQSRRWRVRAARTFTPPSAALRSRSTPVYAEPRYRYASPPSYYYPKYTGAFHARYFDDIPSIYGTRPMRGTAW